MNNFNSAEYLNRINDLLAGAEFPIGEPMMLSNSYGLDSYYEMIRTALIAIEVLAEKIGNAQPE